MALSRVLSVTIPESCLKVAALRSLEGEVSIAKFRKLLILTFPASVTLASVWLFIGDSAPGKVGAVGTRLPILLLVPTLFWAIAIWRVSVRYYFAEGYLICKVLGCRLWKEDLRDLAFVEEVGARFGPTLVFHWPMASRTLYCDVSDLARLGVPEG